LICEIYQNRKNKFNISSKIYAKATNKNAASWKKRQRKKRKRPGFSVKKTGALF